MKAFSGLWRVVPSTLPGIFLRSRHLPTISLAQACSPSRPQLSQHRTFKERINPADDPDFLSIADQPNRIVSTRQKHGPGLILLGTAYALICTLFESVLLIFCVALIPITAFALGTWQVKRLNWKTEMIAKYEDRLVRSPLPLPPRIDPSVIDDFDYRPVYTVGRFRHDQEMLIGPRIQNGENGYLVITPLERKGGSTILVNRGWIAKKMAKQRDRPDGLPQGEAIVSGLLRKPFKKNIFTPDNEPETGAFYFPNVEEMAELTGSQPVWMEETMSMAWN